jgi:hypothetical protein
VFAGLTVVIALAALSVVGVPFLTQMGLAAALTVAIAVVIALTLLPALLGFAGRRVLGRSAGTRGRSAGTRGRSAGTRGRSAGTRGRSAGTTTFGTRWARAIARRPVAGLLVAVAATAAVNPAGDTALLTVIPTSGPGDAATKDLVHTLRDLDGTIAGAGIGVTGLTAINIDVSTKLGDALIPYLAVVVGLAFLLLMLVFRSLLVPIKATPGLPAQRRRHLRCRRGGLPVGLGCRPARRRADRADRRLRARRGRALRRVHRPDDRRAGRHDAARQRQRLGWISGTAGAEEPGADSPEAVGVGEGSTSSSAPMTLRCISTLDWPVPPSWMSSYAFRLWFSSK